MQGGYIGDHWEDGCQVFVGKKSGDLSFLVKLWNAYTLVLLAQKVLLEDSYDLCNHPSILSHPSTYSIEDDLT